VSNSGYLGSEDIACDKTKEGRAGSPCGEAICEDGQVERFVPLRDLIPVMEDAEKKEHVAMVKMMALDGLPVHELAPCVHLKKGGGYERGDHHKVQESEAPDRKSHEEGSHIYQNIEDKFVYVLECGHEVVVLPSVAIVVSPVKRKRQECEGGVK